MKWLNVALVATFIAGLAFITGGAAAGGFLGAMFVGFGMLTGYIRNDIDRMRDQVKAERRKRQDARDATA